MRTRREAHRGAVPAVGGHRPWKHRNKGSFDERSPGWWPLAAAPALLAARACNQKPNKRRRTEVKASVTLYDYQGDALDGWSGKFDVSEDDNEVYFDDADGKRVIIQGGIVVCEEN